LSWAQAQTGVKSWLSRIYVGGTFKVLIEIDFFIGYIGWVYVSK